MVEIRHIECKVCKNTIRAYQSKAKVSKGRMWETDGRLWSGRICPDCHRLQMKQYQRAKRSSNVSNP